MAVYKNSLPFGSIVTDGLVLNLDATNQNSYPGSGTTWFDTSFYRNNGTLINGPAFSQNRGSGSIVFDGTDDVVQCENSSSLQITTGTILAWVKTSNAGAGFRGIIVKQNNYGLFLNDNVLVTYDWGNTATRSTAINIADGTWKHVAMSFTENTGTPSNNATIYLNGSSVLVTTIKLSDNTVKLELGRGGEFGGSTQLLNGSISEAQVYNRALSTQEVQQNYNALKSRFGL